MKFATLEDYEKAVDHEQQELQEGMLAAIKNAKFKNYAKLDVTSTQSEDKSKGQEMDEFLAQLLNVDGAVQIQDHIYKVDLAKEKVFVIKAEDRASSYQDLITGNTANKTVSEYSTDDDVLYAVRDGVVEKCGGIGDYLQFSTIEITPQERYVFQHKNFKGGIWFNFKAFMFQTEGEGITLSPYTVSMYYTIHSPNLKLRKRPCKNGDLIIKDAGTFAFSGGTATYKEWTAYSGTRNLNGIYSYMSGRLIRNGVTYNSTPTLINVNF